MKRPALVWLGGLTLLAGVGCGSTAGDEGSTNPVAQGGGGQAVGAGGVTNSVAGASGSMNAATAGSGGMMTVAAGGTVAAAGSISAGGGAAGSGGMSAGGGGAAGDAMVGGAGGGGGGGASGLYAPAPRDIMIDASRGNMTIGVSVTEADPAAEAFHGGDQPASFDAGAAVIRKKLVIGLHGIGNGPGPGGAIGWAAQRGFHTLALDYYNTESGEQGAGYLEIWSGEDFTPDFEVTVVNSVRNRVKSALAWLSTQDPGADWAYYLNADGSVRWSDVIAFGYSFGGQTAAAATKLDPLDRAIATSAPGIDADAPMMAMPSITPGERGWALFDETDGGERKGAAATALGWPGMPIDVTQNAPPYMDSHILLLNGGGHSEFCSRAEFDEACEVAFGIAPTP